MVITKDDRALLLSALATEVARVKRAINTASNQSIKEIHNSDLLRLNDLAGRVSNEVVK